MHYEAAERFLNQCKSDGEVVDLKKWKEALSYCYKDKFFKEYTMKQFKNKIHALELIKREFIHDKAMDNDKSEHNEYR